jgi:hypothetical protein
MAACAFDYAGGDRPSLFERAAVVEVVAFGEQVVRAVVGVLPGASIQAQAGGFAPDRGGERFLGDPLLGGWVAFGEEGPGGGPDVLEDVNEIAADVPLDLAGFRLGLDTVDLVFRAVDHGDPGALVVGVSALRLAEDL